jgi:hypothetical protein
MTRIRHITVALIALAMLGIAAPAAQAGYRDAIRDCADDGFLQGTYTKKELRQARSHLPSDLQEYSDCDDVLSRALAALANKNRGGKAGGDLPPAAGDPNLTTGSGAVAPNPDQYNALKRQQGRSTGDAAPPAVSVDGRKIVPGSGLVNAAARTSPNTLPGPLLLALIALAVMGALAASFLLRQRWPETRRVALRLLRR